MRQARRVLYSPVDLPVPYYRQRTIDGEISTHNIGNVPDIAESDASQTGTGSRQHTVETEIIGAVARNRITMCGNDYKKEFF